MRPTRTENLQNDENDESDKSLRSIKPATLYSFERLEIWQLGMKITKEIYRVTKSFPRDEVFGLVSQMRRAASSIPMNIAEGSSRRSKKDFALFLRRAIGSTLELVTATDVSKEENYVVAEDYELLKSLYEKEYFKLIAFEKGLFA